MKRLPILVTVLVTTLLVISLAISCAEPEPEPTPAPTPTPTPEPEPTPTPEQVLIRMTTPIPPGDPFITWAQEGMDKFNARTNGAYKMQLFPGCQLGPFPESLDLIRTGAVEGGMIPPAAFAGSIPELGLPELPFLFNNAEANAYAATCIKDTLGPLLETQANQKTVGCFTVGTLNLLSVKPVKTLEDLEGLIVGCDSPPMVELVNVLGGSGLVVDFTEDYSNMQKGVFDAKTSAAQYIFIAKLYEIAKNYTVFHGLGTLYSFNINLDVYNKMPQELKDALNEEMSVLAQSLSQKKIEEYYERESDLTELGVEYYYLPVTERDRWKSMAYPGTLDMLAQFGDVGEKIKQCADEANAKYPYTE